MRWLRVVLAMAALGWGRADACSSAPPQCHTLDPDEQALDHTPPGPITAAVDRVKRGSAGAGCSHNSCEDIGSIDLSLTGGEDDRTPTDQLGYELTLLDGTLPRGLDLPDCPIRGSGQIYFNWVDGNSDDQEPIAFTLGITPIDLAGNRGPMTTVEIRDPGSGCAVGGRGTSALAWLTLLVCLRWARAGGRVAPGGASSRRGAR